MGWDVTYKRFECSFTKEELQLIKTAVRAMIKADPEYGSRDWIDFNFRIQDLGDIYVPPPRPCVEPDIPLLTVAQQRKKWERRIKFLEKRMYCESDIQEIQINQAWLYAMPYGSYIPNIRLDGIRDIILTNLEKFEENQVEGPKKLIESLKELE